MIFPQVKFIGLLRGGVPRGGGSLTFPNVPCSVPQSSRPESLGFPSYPPPLNIPPLRNPTINLPGCKLGFCFLLDRLWKHKGWKPEVRGQCGLLWVAKQPPDIPLYMVCNQVSNEKNTWLLAVYRGLYYHILPTFIGIIISHCKDPY